DRHPNNADRHLNADRHSQHADAFSHVARDDQHSLTDGHADSHCTRRHFHADRHSATYRNPDGDSPSCPDRPCPGGPDHVFRASRSGSPDGPVPALDRQRRLP
ncbi:MAG TPA: hypothetical protein VNN21_02900, partial [Dehalococcoidia bacterium]|nr:hypothetical protein [Dehalococcoidia bacterium]